MTDAPPPRPFEPRLTEPRRGPRLSALWLAPLIALAIAGTAFWRYYAALGPEIAIALDSAAGVEAGRTPIRYRDVEVGRVEALRLTEDMQGVVAVARMDAAVAALLTEGTEFWPVRARISAAEISGVETLLSGAYFGVAWGPRDAAPARRFTARDAPPLTPAGTPGRRVALRGASGGDLQPGAPVTLHGYEVGRIESRRIGEEGRSFEFDLFIDAPFDRLIGPETRFWNASGVDVELGAEGLRLSVASLSTVLRGGVAIDNIPGAAALHDGGYVLYPTEAAARDSVFDSAPEQQFRLTMRIGQSVRGLSVGAPVQFRGVDVGEVEALAIDSARSLADVAVVATLRLQPRRIGIDTDDPEARLRVFARAVDQGLRARLATGNLLTGALFVELAELTDAEPARLVLDAGPHPRIPTAPSAFDALRGDLQATLARIRSLPIETLVGAAVETLANLADITGDPALQAAPGELNAALSSVAATLGALENADAAGALTRALGSAEAAAGAVQTAAAQLPAVVSRLNAAAAAAEAALSAYSPAGPVNAEAVAALREVRTAARAATSLMQTLERQPNSLILGR